MMQVMWILVYALSLLLLVHSKKFLHIATRDKLLPLLVGIAVVSVLWSAAPEATLPRSVAIVGTTLFGIYLATRYDLGELLRLLA
jgi:exopolysaccharide production protein ExoQ